MLSKTINYNIFLTACLLFSAISCTRHHKEKNRETVCVDIPAPVFPDYADTLVLPPNIAPLNFKVSNDSLQQGPYFIKLYAASPSGELLDSLSLKTNRFVHFGITSWKRLLQKAAGCEGSLLTDIYACGKESHIRYRRKIWHVSCDSIDAFLTYRLSAHDENPCLQLQVYERSLENFSKRLLMDNRFTDNNCMNCHTNSDNNADKMLVHLRGEHAGTLLFKDGRFIKIALPDGYPDLRLAYPSWNRSGRYIAFASTRIMAFPHANRYRTQDLIADTLGKILIYDVEKKRLFSCPDLMDERYEFSFPAWSADGKKLYFCRTEKLSGLRDFQYDLLSIPFDEATGNFGSPQTVYAFRNEGKSVSMPQVCPNGRYMLATTLLIGSFPSQNQGDLCLVDLWTGKVRELDMLNSEDGEKYHSWSSNGRWVVFGSKRINGGTAAIYIAHFDRRGHFSKPFVLPQEDNNFYLKNTRSFLFPTLSKNPAGFHLQDWEYAVKQPAVFPDMEYFKDFYHPGSGVSRAGH